MIIELTRCPVCSNSALAALPRPTTWIGTSVFEQVADRLGLTRCSACGFVFVNPRPSEGLLARFYATADYDCHSHDAEESDPSLRLDHALDLLDQYRPADRKGRLLDFGCGGGYFLRAASRHGWDGVGYDVERARNTCREHGLRIVGDLLAVDGPVDLLTLHHVFEHLPDHRTFFDTIDHLVDADTLVFIEVPNARSLRAQLALPALTGRFPVDERYRAFPIHLSYFTFDTLAVLLDRFGYEIVARYNFGVGLDEYFTSKSLVTPSRNVGKSGDGGSAFGSGRVKTAISRVKARSTRWLKQRIKRAIWDAELGENIAVVARKVSDGGHARRPSRRVRAFGQSAELDSRTDLTGHRLQ